MIDWIAFVDALDEHNFILLEKSVQMKRMDIAEEEAKALVLSFPEVQAARENPYKAVGMIHRRLDCGLGVAKLAVDNLLMDDADEAALAEQYREDGGDGPQEDEDETVIGYEQMFVD